MGKKVGWMDGCAKEACKCMYKQPKYHRGRATHSIAISRMSACLEPLHGTVRRASASVAEVPCQKQHAYGETHPGLDGLVLEIASTFLDFPVTAGRCS